MRKNPQTPAIEPETGPRFLGQTMEFVDIDSIFPHPANPNRGDVDAIALSIDVNGFYSVVTCQVSSRRIVAGEHRWRGLKKENARTCPVLWIDCTDDEAEVILLADNKYSQLSRYDPVGLQTLLEDVKKRQGDLTGTGWITIELDDLIERNRPPSVADVAKQHGPPDPTAFWPIIKLLVPDTTKERFETLMKLSPGDQDHEKFMHILEVATPAIVKEPDAKPVKKPVKKK